MDAEVPQTPPGWYADPEQAATQRYWNGKAWTDQRAPMSAPATPLVSGRTVRRIVAVALVVLGVLYLTGHLDHLLYPVGLNYQECGKNGYGSVYCGSELSEYKQRVEGPLHEAQEKARELARESEFHSLYGR